MQEATAAVLSWATANAINGLNTHIALNAASAESKLKFDEDNIKNLIMKCIILFSQY